MPPLPSVPATLKMDLHFHVGGDSAAMCRLHWRFTGSTPTGTSLALIAADIRSNFNTDMAGQLGSGNELASVVLTDISSSTGAQGVDSTAVVGTRAGGQLPNSIAAIANYGIARRYRGGKPRSYWPMGTASDVQSDGTWTAGFTASLKTQLQIWFGHITGITHGGTTMADVVSVSYYSGFHVVTSPTTGRARNVPLLRGGGPQIDPLLSTAINSKPGSQRRRALHSL